MVFRKVLLPLTVLTGLLRAAGVPNTDMGITTIGVEYQGLLSKQSLTATAAHSELRTFNFLLRYAPVPYLLFSAGAGGTQYAVTTDTMQFNTPAISVAGGLDLYSPVFRRFLSVTAGSAVLLFNSTLEKDSAWLPTLLITPSAGVLFRIGTIGGIETGAKGYFVTALKGDDTPGTANPVRGYLALNLHTPEKAAYFSFIADASPYMTSGSSEGPDDFSCAVQIGLLIRPRRKLNRKVDDERSPEDYFRNYDTMSRELDTLATELKKKRKKEKYPKGRSK